jgi:ABC-type glycerol-3-phosphate transport system substrate-binding protein
MSVKRYRRVAAIALVASVGLTTAACTKDSGETAGKVTITVDCPPLKTDNDGKTLAQWNKDVATFEAANPGVKIITISVGAQCNNPPDFTARLQGGTQADVFYGYMTDLSQVLDANGAEDITQYVTKDTVPNWEHVLDSVKNPFMDGGKIYGIGYSAYTMGLVYNKNIFTQAGLDPNKPPSTWQEVATAAKTISAKVPGAAGYSEYSAGNTGGWHFTASLYSRGSSPVSADGKKANVNTPEAKAVLSNLKAMRFTDNSVGTTQLQTWPDLLTNAAAGKVGMYIGAPDSMTAIVNTFKGKFSDWAMAPMPGDGGAAKGALGGGNGYFFKKGLTADQIKAGLKWLAFEELTPGEGQFNYTVQKSIGLPVGLPQPLIWKPGSDLQKKDDDLKKANSNLNLTDYALYAGNPIRPVAEPANAQAIYAILDGPMGAVLTDPNANIDALLADAQTKIQKVLDDANKK